MVFACEKFWPYILGSHVIIQTNHATIKYLMENKDGKPILIRWVLLLQEFSIDFKDKKGSDNVTANHLSRIEKPIEEEKGIEIEENSLDEQLFQVTVHIPWYADMVNYLACGIMPPELTYQQKRKLRTNAKFYIWDDQLLFKRGVDQIIRRCVLEVEQAEILDKCHASPYGGHFVEDRTSQKILQ